MTEEKAIKGPDSKPLLLYNDRETENFSCPAFSKGLAIPDLFVKSQCGSVATPKSLVDSNDALSLINLINNRVGVLSRAGDDIV